MGGEVWLLMAILYYCYRMLLLLQGYELELFNYENKLESICTLFFENIFWTLLPFINYFHSIDDTKNTYFIVIHFQFNNINFFKLYFEALNIAIVTMVFKCSLIFKII